MNRTKLGERMLCWHGGQNDPIYAVGSFFIGNKKYPKQEIVSDALSNLNRDISVRQRMLRNEIVSTYNVHYGRMVPDLKKFAGYSDAELQKDIADLEEIVEALNKYYESDYT